MRNVFAHRRPRSTRWWFAASVISVALLAVIITPIAMRRTSAHAARALSNPAPRTSTTVAAATPTTATTATTAWPKTLTLITDSVTLGAEDTLRAALPGWSVEVLGKPALMVKQAVPKYLPPGRSVGSVVVIGLGYNSLWERNRKNFGDWAGQFDREANELVADLRARGAKKIVWVTVREPSHTVVNADGEWQYEHYAWFFPYVNERLHALVHRQPDIALADWAAVSNTTGVTYDLIHLNPRGALVMAHAIVDAVDAR